MFLILCDLVLFFKFKLQNFSTWILAMSTILYNQVMCSDYSNDFEVFHTSGGGVKSQSLYPDPAYNHDDDFEDDTEARTIQKRFASFDLSDLEQISATPEFTLSHLYVSPEEAERRFTRSALGPKNDYVDGYSSFLSKYFDKTDEKHSDTHDDEEDNGKNSKYRQVPKEVEQIDKEHHYDNAYNDYEYDRIKSLSQKQEAEIKQNPKNCKVVVKGEMTCSTCKDPVTGAHSESCSFSSAPADKKYAYIKQRAYNSKDDEKKKKDDNSEEDDEDKPEEDWEGDEEATNKNEKKVKPSTTPAPAPRGRGTRRPAPKQSAAYTAPKNAPPQRRQRNPNQRRFSANYKAEESRPQREVIGLDPFLYKHDDKTDRTYERYFSHVFPEAKNGKLQRQEEEDSSAEVEFLPNYDSKKNVEEVLAEFKTKDWSQCKKEIKGDLTCYQCKDNFGVKHEECMFVSGSAPTRLAYSETKEYHDPEGVNKKDNNGSGSEVVAKTSFVPDTNKTQKVNRKLIVRKRKAKLQDDAIKSTRPTTSTTTEAAPKPEDSVDQKDGVGKRTIKRMVSYHYEDHSHPEPDVLVYEHNLSHIL